MRNFLLIIIGIGILIALPSRSFAIEEKFFEYAVDVGTPIEVPTGSVVIQEFKIYNDFISGVDVWFDNVGSAGNATVSLLSASNAVLAVKGVSIPHSDPFYAGQRLYVKFNTSIGVTSGNWYKLKITSATPTLRIYGIKRVQFVEHNAPYPVDYSVGASLLNDDAQFAVYKFALYEEIDNDPPVIINASSSIAGPDAVTVSFNANELVDRSLTYAPVGSSNISTIGFTGDYTICFEGISSCPVTFSTVRNTTYVYRLTVRDSWGNEAYYDGTFESWRPATPPPADEQQTPTPEQPTSPIPPVITPLSITNERVVSVTKSSVVIAWDTNRSANSVMTVSTAPVGGQVVATVTDDTREILHTASVLNTLVANTSYYAVVSSHDQNGITTAKVVPFTTLQQSSTTTIPVVQTPSSQSVQAILSDDQRSLTVSWASFAGGEPTNGYRVDVIDAQGNLLQTVSVSAGTHTAVVSGLTAGQYQAVVYADNGGVVEKVAQPAVVTARKASSPIDTYALIKKPIVYIPAGLFVMLIGGLGWYSRKQRKIGEGKTK